MNSDWPYYTTTWNGSSGMETHRTWIDPSAVAMEQPFNLNLDRTTDASLIETILRLMLHPDMSVNTDDTEQDRPQTRASQHNQPSPTVNQPSTSIDVLTEYSSVMRAYNENIQGYISSMNTYHENMRQLMTDMRPRGRADTSSIYDFTYMFQPNLRIPTATSRLNNRVPILSQDQIAQSTRIVLYSADINEPRCPISLDNFTEGEEITQIVHCGHVFRTQNLMNWFRRSSRCPVCRHNIMTYTPANSTVGDAAYTYDE